MPAEQPRPEVREVEDESTIMHEVSLNGKIYQIKVTVGITIRYVNILSIIKMREKPLELSLPY